MENLLEDLLGGSKVKLFFKNKKVSEENLKFFNEPLYYFYPVEYITKNKEINDRYNQLLSKISNSDLMYEELLSGILVISDNPQELRNKIGEEGIESLESPKWNKLKYKSTYGNYNITLNRDKVVNKLKKYFKNKEYGGLVTVKEIYIKEDNLTDTIRLNVEFVLEYKRLTSKDDEVLSTFFISVINPDANNLVK